MGEASEDLNRDFTEDSVKVDRTTIRIKSKNLKKGSLDFSIADISATIRKIVTPSSLRSLNFGELSYNRGCGVIDVYIHTDVSQPGFDLSKLYQQLTSRGYVIGVD